MTNSPPGRLPALLLWLLLTLAAATGGPARAQDSPAVPPAQDDLVNLAADLDEIERELTQLRAEAGPDVEHQLVRILDRSDELSGDAQVQLARLQQQLNALGAAPGPADPPEPVEIASQRSTTQRSLSSLEA